MTPRQATQVAGVMAQDSSSGTRQPKSHRRPKNGSRRTSIPARSTMHSSSRIQRTAHGETPRRFTITKPRVSRLQTATPKFINGPARITRFGATPTAQSHLLAILLLERTPIGITSELSIPQGNWLYLVVA